MGFKSEDDLANEEHNEDAVAKDVVLFGKTAGGSFLPFLVDSEGRLI